MTTSLLHDRNYFEAHSIGLTAERDKSEAKWLDK